jgi:hypothetical protein
MTTRTFRPYDPDAMWLLPPSLQEWLPEGPSGVFLVGSRRDAESDAHSPDLWGRHSEPPPIIPSCW